MVEDSKSVIGKSTLGAARGAFQGALYLALGLLILRAIVWFVLGV